MNTAALVLVPHVVTKATILPVSVADARAFARVSHNEDDPFIGDLVQTAFDWLQPPFGCLRISLATQTLRLDLPCWPAWARWARWPHRHFELPAGPVQSVASVKYFDQNNADQTVSPADYFLDNDVLMFAKTFIQPSLYARPSAVRITYAAGYADAADVPEMIKTAIKQCVAHWYENREAVQAIGPLAIMPVGVDALIDSHRLK
jgi:uncharacterized phiE125 gp8 family phage protein